MLAKVSGLSCRQPLKQHTPLSPPPQIAIANITALRANLTELQEKSRKEVDHKEGQAAGLRLEVRCLGLRAGR